MPSVAYPGYVRALGRRWASGRPTPVSTDPVPRLRTAAVRLPGDSLRCDVTHPPAPPDVASPFGPAPSECRSRRHARLALGCVVTRPGHPPPGVGRAPWRPPAVRGVERRSWCTRPSLAIAPPAPSRPPPPSSSRRRSARSSSPTASNATGPTQEGQGRPPAHVAGRAAQGRRLRAGRRARRARPRACSSRRCATRRRPQDAAQGPAHGRGDRRPRSVGEGRGRLARGRDRRPRSRRPANCSPTSRSASGRSSRSRIRRSRPCETPDWVRSPIDAFILAKLEAKGLRPARPADKYALLRRVTFDLTGLPPTPEEIEAFLKDDSPTRVREGGRPAACVAGLRRALGPALARRRPLRRLATASTRTPPSATPGAIATTSFDSFNQDKPYDQFLREQIAGDLLPDAAREPRPADRDRLPGAGAKAAGRAGQAEDEDGHRRRAARHARQGGPRADARLRPLPRPQVRPDPDSATTTACCRSSPARGR